MIRRILFPSSLIIAFFLPLALQGQTKINPVTGINWPPITGSGAPSGGACSSLNYGQRYVNITPNPIVTYTCGPFGWQQSSGGSGSGTVSDGAGTTTPGLDAISTDVAHAQTYAQRACPFITDPPYNAACDGSTDDSAAIQAAMNGNACIQLPISTLSDTPQCNFGTSLVQNNTHLTILGNNSILLYTGTGAGYSIAGVAAYSSSLRVQDLTTEGTVPTPSSQTFWDVSNISTSIFSNWIDEAGSVISPAGDNASYTAMYVNASGSHGAAILNLSDGISFGNINVQNMANVEVSNFELGGISHFDAAYLGVSNVIAITLDTTPTFADDTYSFNSLSLGGNLTMGVPRVVSGHIFLSATSTFTGSATEGQLCLSQAGGSFPYYPAAQCRNYGTYSAATYPIPSCSSTVTNTTAFVSDSTTNTWGATYSSGGSDKAAVYCDGTNWTIYAK